ncbi:hypothetical protein DSM104443_00932 [Usitatibacter rugosus]|uniref:DUF3606 domain-containing protein n=1 Tax=Usitatibacter rugosus TaxID=2732067 RepID=A0A6M4GRZ2_9PROT|nr:DUF3606 domain-containing protein [Usitatibacter rugosus]QJR09882.1 hypothetical protein DSM104443_00932 [Usitatibacter rugosus]
MTAAELTTPAVAITPDRAARAPKGRNDSPIFLDLSLPGTALYWTTRWGVTLEVLQQAVAIVGSNSADVAAHLGLPKRKSALAS